MDFITADERAAEQLAQATMANAPEPGQRAIDPAQLTAAVEDDITAALIIERRAQQTQRRRRNRKAEREVERGQEQQAV